MSRYKYSKRAAEFNCKSIEYRESGYYVADGLSWTTYHMEWQSKGDWSISILDNYVTGQESLLKCLEWIRLNEESIALEIINDRNKQEAIAEQITATTSTDMTETCEGCERYALIERYREAIRKLVAENKDLKRNYAHLQGVRDGLLLAQGLDERGK